MSDPLPSDRFMRALLAHTFAIDPTAQHDFEERNREPCPWCGERWECTPESVDLNFPDTCRHCGCFRDSANHAPVIRTELDALLDRVREDKADTTGKNRNVVAYDCWRMFENLAKRYKEEFAMRDRYKRQSNSWRDKALRMATLLSEVDAIDDGDTPLCWQHTGLFERIHAELTDGLPTLSDSPLSTDSKR